MINCKTSLILTVMIFKIITSSGDNFSEEIIMTPCLTDVHMISWQNLTRMPWILSESSKVSITDDKFPTVESSVDVQTLGTIDLFRGRSVLYNFTIAGEAKSEDIKSIALNGKGMWLVDEATQKPIAGRLTLTRNVLPSLWETGGSEEKIIMTDELAWVEVP